MTALSFGGKNLERGQAFTVNAEQKKNLELAGLAEPGARVSIDVEPTARRFSLTGLLQRDSPETVTADAAGRWSWPGLAALPDGTYHLALRQTVGGRDSKPLRLTAILDTTAPTKPDATASWSDADTLSFTLTCPSDDESVEARIGGADAAGAPNGAPLGGDLCAQGAERATITLDPADPSGGALLRQIEEAGRVVTFVASDAAGNIAARTLTVPDRPLRITAPAEGADFDDAGDVRITVTGTPGRRVHLKVHLKVESNDADPWLALSPTSSETTLDASGVATFQGFSLPDAHDHGHGNDWKRCDERGDEGRDREAHERYCSASLTATVAYADGDARSSDPVTFSVRVGADSPHAHDQGHGQVAQTAATRVPSLL